MENVFGSLVQPSAMSNVGKFGSSFFHKWRVMRNTLFSVRYQQLLDEIHQCYLDQRELLLSPSINSTITDLTGQNNKDHCALVSESTCASL